MFKVVLFVVFVIFVKVNLIESAARIIGGQAVKDASEFPYMCSILVKYRVQGVERWYHLCGAAVINYKFVITAAHCARYAQKK